MSLFNFNEAEIYSFFAVLIRYSVLFSVLPFIGDRLVPGPVKVLLSLAVTIALFPALVARSEVRPSDALRWSQTAGGIAGIIAMEALVGLILGFTARLAFETISFGGNLVGTFMGFATASVYDPHQESQTQVISEIQMVCAMLIFLILDGHHIMLRAALESYKIIGVGGIGVLKSGLGPFFSHKLVELTGQVVRFGIELSAPVAISLFAVNVAFGILAKAMPQLNVLALSFAVSALVGLVVMFLSVPEFFSVSGNIVGRMGTSMQEILTAMARVK